MVNSDMNSNKQEFIKKLELIRDLEAEKPIEEMDVSLIKTCVELILELRGEKPHLSTEEVKEKVRKIPFVEETTTLNTPPESVKGRSTKVKSNKILLIAAIIAILVTIFTISSIAFNWNIFDELKNKFGTVFNAPVNEEMVMGGVTVESQGKIVTYNNLDEALKSVAPNLLYPTELPENTEIISLKLYQKDGKDKVTFVFNDEKLLFSVTFDEVVSDDIKDGADEVLVINDYRIYLKSKPSFDMCQIHFEYKNNIYKISYTDKQGLIDIVGNLKESK